MTKEHCVFENYLTERDLQTSKGVMKTYVGIILKYTIIEFTEQKTAHIRVNS